MTIPSCVIGAEVYILAAGTTDIFVGSSVYELYVLLLSTRMIIWSNTAMKQYNLDIMLTLLIYCTAGLLVRYR